MKKFTALLLAVYLFLPSNLFAVYQLAPAGINESGIEDFSASSAESLSVILKKLALNQPDISPKGINTLHELKEILEEFLNSQFYRKLTPAWVKELSIAVSKNLESPLGLRLALFLPAYFMNEYDFNINSYSQDELDNMVRLFSFLQVAAKSKNKKNIQEIVKNNLKDLNVLRAQILNSGIIAESADKNKNDRALEMLTALLDGYNVSDDGRKRGYDIAHRIIRTKQYTDEILIDALGCTGRYGVMELLSYTSRYLQAGTISRAKNALRGNELIPYAEKILLDTVKNSANDELVHHAADILDSIISFQGRHLAELLGIEDNYAVEFLQKKYFDVINYPTFREFVSSVLFQDGPRNTLTKINSIISMEVFLSTKVFYKLLSNFGFNNVSNWANQAKHFDSRVYIFLASLDIKDKTARAETAIREAMRANDPALLHEVMVLLLTGDVKLDSSTVHSFINVIIENPSKSYHVMAFLISALKLKTIRFTEGGFIQEEISKLLNSDIRGIYYLASTLIRSIPYSADTGVSIANKIRDTVAKIDDQYGRNNNFLSYVRLKLHRDPSSDDRDFINTVMLAIKRNEPLLLKPFIKPEAQKDVLPIAVLESDALGSVEFIKYFEELHGILTEAMNIYSAKMGEQVNRPFLIPLEELDEIFGKIGVGTAEQRNTVKWFIELERWVMRRYPTHDSLREDLSSTGMEHQSGLFGEIKLMLSKNDKTEKDIVNILKKIALERRRIQNNILAKKPLNIHKKHYQKRHVVDDKWGFLNAGFYSEYSEDNFNSYNMDRKLEIYEDLFFDQLFNSAYSGIYKNIYEKTVNVDVLGEKLPIDKNSASDLRRMINILTMLLDKTEYHGMTVRRMREINRLLKTQTLTLGQLRDIVDQLDETKLWFYDLFNYTFMDFPEVVARKTGLENLNPRLRKILEEKGLRPEDGDKYFRYIHEKTLGDIMAESAILAQLDRFITRSAEILQMSQQIFRDDVVIERKKENMPYVDFKQAANNKVSPSPAVMGGKGFGLYKYTKLKLPVPPWACLTADVYHQPELWLSTGKKRSELEEMVVNAILQIESQTGKAFPFDLNRFEKIGRPDIADKIRKTRVLYSVDADKILFVSVRSGSYISMPGMLATILNVPMNDDIAKRMIRSGMDPIFVLDLYRTFLANYGEAYGCINPTLFTDIIDDRKKLIAEANNASFEDVTIKEFSVADYKHLIDAYKNIIQAYLPDIDKQLDDPFYVLMNCIEAVFGSWNAGIAVKYRKYQEISEHWGTACIIQQMVFGNLNKNSGSWVIFSRDYGTGVRTPVGDYKPGSQGINIVSGRSGHSMLVSRIQKTENTKEPVVQEVYRKRYAHIKNISEILDQYEELPQDIEGTTEQVQVRNRSTDTLFGIRLNNLPRQPREVVNTYLLQSRPAPVMAKRKMYNLIIKDEIPAGEGVAVSGGGIAGRAVDAMGKTDEEFEKEVNDLREWMDKNGEQHLGIIMLINYTAPEEVHKIEMKNIDGILSFAVTSSHAALTARREGKAFIGQTKGLTYSGGEWRLNSQRIFLGIPERTSFKFNPEIGIISMNAHLPTIDRKNSGNIYLNKKLAMEPLDYHNNFPKLPDNLFGEYTNSTRASSSINRAIKILPLKSK